MSDNINGMRVICDTCKVKLTRPLPNKLTEWQDSGKSPSFSQTTSLIKGAMSMLDPYGFGDGGFHYHEMISDLKVYALFRRDHKDHRITMLRRGAMANLAGYSNEEFPSEMRINNSWNKWGEWIGGNI